MPCLLTYCAVRTEAIRRSPRRECGTAPRRASGPAQRPMRSREYNAIMQRRAGEMQICDVLALAVEIYAHSRASLNGRPPPGPGGPYSEPRRHRVELLQAGALARAVTRVTAGADLVTPWSPGIAWRHMVLWLVISDNSAV